MDGLGGIAKSMVQKEVMARRAVVQNSMDFFSAVLKTVPSTIPIHTSGDDIKTIIKNDNPWENVQDAPGIK